MQKYIDYAIHTWGFEDPATIDLILMIQNSVATEENIKEYIRLTDICIAEDWFGF